MCKKKTHPRMSAFIGLIILMVATYVAFCCVYAREVQSGGGNLVVYSNVTRKKHKKLFKKAEKHSKSAVHLLAFDGSKQVRTVLEAMNKSANKQSMNKSANKQSMNKSANKQSY